MLAPLWVTSLSSPSHRHPGVPSFLSSLSLCLSNPGLATTSGDAVHHTGLFMQRYHILNPVNVQWRICPDLKTTLMPTFYRHTRCTCSSQQRKGSTLALSFHSPGPLQDCRHLYSVCTVQEHCEEVCRLIFCFETVARWSMFF